MARQKIVGIDTLPKELRLEMIRFGMVVIEDLATEIAKIANTKAPTIGVTDFPGFPARRGPDKNSGRSTSGPIKGNIFAQQSEKVPNSWLVVSPAWYSHFPEYGTKKHIIKSKRSRKSMAFPASSSKGKGGTVTKSGVVLAKQVNHPGVRGKGRKPFLRPSADQAEQILKRILSQIKG